MTHDVDEALLLADDIQVMSSAPGRIIRTHQLNLERPRSLKQSTQLLDIREDILRLLHPVQTSLTEYP